MAMEWEVSKENVQPSKGGRNIGILNQVLKAKLEKGEGSSSLTEQRREHLRAIDTYDGDDPLRPWLRYIKWAKESFPSETHAELLPILEKCTRNFQKVEKYREDVRYLRVWIQYADCCAEPRDIFKFLEANSIGQDHALFYEAYATYLELRRSFAKANLVFERGVARGASPVDRLSSMHKSFQERMAKRIQRKMQEGATQSVHCISIATTRLSPQEQEGVAANQQDDDLQPARSFGASHSQSTRRSGVPRAPLPPHGSRPTQREHSKSRQKEEFSVFVDEAFGAEEQKPAKIELASAAGPSAQWESLGTQAEGSKENTLQPKKWTDVKIPQKKGLVQHAPVAELDVFVDEEFMSAAPSNERSNTAAPAGLQVRRDGDATATQGELSRDPLHHFTHPPPLLSTSSTPPACAPPPCSQPSVGLPAAANPSGRGSCIQNPKEKQQEQLPDGNTARSGVGVGVGGVGYLPELLILDGQEVCIEEARLVAWEATHPRQQAEEPVDGAMPAVDTRAAQNTEAAAGGERGKEVAARPKSLLSLFSDVASSEPAALPPVRSDASRASDRKPEVMRHGSVERDGQDQEQRSWMGSGGTRVRSGTNVGADDLVLDHLGASPPGGGGEGRHEGLVDPTINTKEALADIMSMFTEPLPFEKVPAGSKRAASSRQDRGAAGGGEAAGGFQIYTDETGEHDGGMGRERGSGHQIQTSLPKKQRQSGSGDVGVMVFQDEEFGAAASVQEEKKKKQQMSEMEEEEEFDGDAENRPPRGAKNVGTPLPPPRSLNSPQVADAALRPLSQERMRELNVVIRSGGSSSEEEREEEEKEEEGKGAPGLQRPDEAEDDAPILSLDKLGMLEGEGSRVGGAESLEDNLTIDNLTERVGNQPLSPAGQLILYPKGAAMQVNPWKKEVIARVVGEATPPLHTYSTYDDVSEQPFSYLSALKNAKKDIPGGLFVQLGAVIYMVKACIGHGAFARIYQAYQCMCDNGEVTGILQDQDGFALKVQAPACPWEYYMYSQLNRRIPPTERECFGRARGVHVYSDCSVLVCALREHGTLQDVVNAYLAKGLSMDESLCVFYTIEMLRMLEALHAAGMVHGDFKPDNLLLRDNDSVEWNEWGRDRPGCWAHKGLCLIDWGRSIDLARFPPGSTCEGDCMTEAFRCSEMVEGRPWTYQADTYGLCGVVHCLLHGKYMEVEKTRGAGDGAPTYRPKAQFKRYWNVPLWKDLFHTLLNVRSCDDLPALRPLREAFEEYLEKQPTMVKSLKWLFMKQNTLVFEQRSRGR